MEVCALGPLAIRTAPGGPLHEITPPVRAAILVGSVALTKRAVPREEAMQRMWPNDPTRRTDASLNGYASEARNASKTSTKQLRADRMAHGILLLRPEEDPELGVAVDVDRLFQAASSSGGDRGLDIQALKLVRGQFLDGYDENRFPWISDARKRCKEDCVKLIRRVMGWPGSRAAQCVERFVKQPAGSLWDFVSQEAEDAAAPDEDDSRWSAMRSYFRDATEEDIASLQRLLLADRPPQYEATVELRLTDTEDRSRYRLRMSLDYKTRQDRFCFAVVARAVHTDLLTAECPELSDSFSLSAAQSVDAFIEAVGAGDPSAAFGLRERGRSATGNSRSTPVKVVRVPEEEKARVLGDLYDEIGSDVVLVAAPISGASGSLRHLSYWVESELCVDDHYCFWVADRPTQVQRIKIDYSGFTHPPDRRAVKLHPMLGNTASQPQHDGNVYMIELDNWLIRNQGVFVTW